MNLHAIVAGAVGAVNPLVFAIIQPSAGSTTKSDGTQAPAYGDPINAMAQVQALTAREVQHLDSLNIQGIMRGVYLSGVIEGLDRPDAKGGDLLTFNGQTWLVTQVLESWDTWTHVAVTLQV